MATKFTEGWVFDEIKKGKVQGADAMFFWMCSQGLMKEELTKLLTAEIASYHPMSDYVDDLRVELLECVKMRMCFTQNLPKEIERMMAIEHHIDEFKFALNRECIEWGKKAMNDVSVVYFRGGLRFSYKPFPNDFREPGGPNLGGQLLLLILPSLRDEMKGRFNSLGKEIEKKVFAD